MNPQETASSSRAAILCFDKVPVGDPILPFQIPEQRFGPCVELVSILGNKSAGQLVVVEERSQRRRQHAGIGVDKIRKGMLRVRDDPLFESDNVPC